MPSAAVRKLDLTQESPINRKPPLSESNPSIQPSRNAVALAETSSYPIHSTPSPHRPPIDFPASKQDQERLLNAREVAARLGVSERWVRDHTTRRSPRIRAVKLGTLIRYRRADIEIFMDSLNTRSFPQPQFGV